MAWSGLTPYRSTIAKHVVHFERMTPFPIFLFEWYSRIRAVNPRRARNPEGLAGMVLIAPDDLKSTLHRAGRLIEFVCQAPFAYHQQGTSRRPGNLYLLPCHLFCDFKPFPQSFSIAPPCLKLGRTQRCCRETEIKHCLYLHRFILKILGVDLAVMSRELEATILTLDSWDIDIGQ